MLKKIKEDVKKVKKTICEQKMEVSIELENLKRNSGDGTYNN